MYTEEVEIYLLQVAIRRLVIDTFKRVCVDYPQSTHLCIIAHTSNYNDGDVPCTRFSTLLLASEEISETHIENAFIARNNLDYNDPDLTEQMNLFGIVYKQTQQLQFRPADVKIDRTLCRMLDAENHWHSESCYVITKDGVTTLHTDCYSGG